MHGSQLEDHAGDNTQLFFICYGCFATFVVGLDAYFVQIYLQAMTYHVATTTPAAIATAAAASSTATTTTTTINYYV